MKKICIALCFLVLAILPNTTALAADTVIELEELDIRVPVPQDWHVITRDTPADDPIFNTLNTDGSALMDYMDENSIYLNAICLSPLSEIVITKIENSEMEDIYDLNLLDDSDLDDLAQSVLGNEQRESTGLVYTDYTVYAHPQARFLVFDFYRTQSGVISYGEQCSTIVNGVMINITMHSYEGPMSASQKSLHQSIVDNTVFTRITEKHGSALDVSSLLKSGLIGGLTALAAYGVVMLIKRSKKRKESTDA